MSCQEEFKAKLRDRGFRLTPQREIVLDVLHRTAGHVTAEAVFDWVQAVSTAVDISTVYRTLELLQELGLVGVIEAADGDQRRYELLTVHGPHVHLRCAACDQETVVGQEEIAFVVDRLADRYDFYPDLDHLVITGRCAACRQADQDH
jgi:Fur family ferric uptake transcriptional regulator